MPPDGETFSQIAMSATILVATTNKVGMCHVLTLVDNERQSFRLVSDSVEMITAVGDAIAILYSRSPEDSMQVEVTMWTLKSKVSVQCRARLQELSFGQSTRHDMERDIKIMLGTNTDYLVLFERHSNPQGFHFTRFSLDGQIHSRGSLKGPDTDTLNNLSNSLMPSDVGGCATVWWSFCDRVIERDSNSKLTELIRIQYEPQRNQLQLKRNPSRYWRQPSIAADLFIWKDVVYYRDKYYFELKTLDLSTEDFAFAVTMSSTPIMGSKEDQTFRQSYDQARIRNHPLESAFFGDENYLVNLCKHGFLAWCFNKDTKMKWAGIEYAHRRQEEMQKRRKERQEWDALDMGQVLRSEQIKLDITGSVGTYRELQEGQNH